MQPWIIFADSFAYYYYFDINNSYYTVITPVY